MKNTKDEQILNSVAETYEAIAESWDRLRQRPLRAWNVLLPSIKEGDEVLDVGCGSGRLFEFLAAKNVRYTGVDGSSRMVEIARKRYGVSRISYIVSETRQRSAEVIRYTKYDIRDTPRFLVSSMQSLPFDDASFDVICCLAAFHHLPSDATRLQALNEMRRVVKPNGKLLMTNWSTYHLATSLRLRPWSLLFGKRDAMIPWKLPDGRVYRRFYHAFLLSELNVLFRSSGWLVQKSCYSNADGEARWLGSLYSFIVARRPERDV